jgi:hypothetical protein
MFDVKEWRCMINHMHCKDFFLVGVWGGEQLENLLANLYLRCCLRLYLLVTLKYLAYMNNLFTDVFNSYY